MLIDFDEIMPVEDRALCKDIVERLIEMSTLPMEYRRELVRHFFDKPGVKSVKEAGQVEAVYQSIVMMVSNITRRGLIGTDTRPTTVSEVELDLLDRFFVRFGQLYSKQVQFY